MNLEQIKCIKVIHNTSDGHSSEEYISWATFYRSFVKERWAGERRTRRVYTIFGTAHKVTTVKSPSGHITSVRLFEFPNTRAEVLAFGELEESL